MLPTITLSATTAKRARSLLLAGLAAASLCSLAGCGVAVVGGAAATTATVASDRRTAGEQVDDKTIQIKAANDLGAIVGDKGRINTSSYAGWLLLVGDVPSEQMKQQIGERAGQIPKVRRVFNELRVGDVTPLSVRTNDTWLTSKVTASLIDTKGVPTRTISVTTERGVVYLMGKVTTAEAERAAKVASGVSGVNKVVKLFEIVTPESLQQRQTPAPIQDNGASGTTPTTPAPAASSGDAQAMPVQ
ncbi:BON domain-containing protein [Candidimonas nitroreducens]|uniref:Phospholipid-binding protein n=1 Tax=Candidimonas nitroreducens TaxID=683354 RepID=A0A225MDN8_9BURK|nr:BON domain-containing protein [Candidimonas nitroreducens]OWT58180.1 phospholipid-binding protein [Candidimonas nitroreducens]